MRFAKAHAYGNDFLYVHQSLVGGVALPALAREMCDRHTGIGADGLIVYTQEGPHVAMGLVNSDGSPAEVSGNGVRALGALVLLHDRYPHAEVTIDTVVGPKHLCVVFVKRLVLHLQPHKRLPVKLYWAIQSL